jgi:hypothetical protein
MRGDEQNQLKTPAPFKSDLLIDPTFSQINLGGQSLKVLETKINRNQRYIWSNHLISTMYPNFDTPL